jgi:hypothetical protein
MLEVTLRFEDDLSDRPYIRTYITEAKIPTTNIVDKSCHDAKWFGKQGAVYIAEAIKQSNNYYGKPSTRREIAQQSQVDVNEIEGYFVIQIKTSLSSKNAYEQTISMEWKKVMIDSFQHLLDISCQQKK